MPSVLLTVSDTVFGDQLIAQLPIEVILVISLQSLDSVFELQICFLCRALTCSDSTINGQIAFFLYTYKTVRAKHEYT